MGLAKLINLGIIREDISYGACYLICVSDITYLSELIPPAFLRKQEGGINSHL